VSPPTLSIFLQYQIVLTSTAGGTGADGLLEGGGEDLRGQVKVLTQVLNTLIGQGVVVVLPRELGLDVLLGVQGLESLDDLQVGDINLVVLGGVEVLLGDQDTIYNWFPKEKGFPKRRYAEKKSYIVQMDRWFVDRVP
jgi:hypothetical protein